MKKQLVMLMAVVLISSSLMACSSNGYTVRNRDVGTVVGGVGGGVLGNVVTGGSAVGTIAGTLGGAYVGRQVGKSTEN